MKPLQVGTHLRELSENYLMNTNMTGFGCFSESLCILVLRVKIALVLDGFSVVLAFTFLFLIPLFYSHDITLDPFLSWTAKELSTNTAK